MSNEKGKGGFSLQLPVKTVRWVLATIATVITLVAGFFGGRAVEFADDVNSAQMTADALLAQVEQTQDAFLTQNAPESTEAATEVVVEPTATATLVPPTETLVPTSTCVVPSNVAEVIAHRGEDGAKTNLFHVLFNNKAGKPVMDIFEDDNGNRIQYEWGDHFFVINEEILGDGGTIWFIVVGPRGAGYFVRNIHIEFFDLNPTLSC